ncbi:MAG: type IV pilus modification protein PilV [Halomonadaceae bacterium]|nr:MAG: type IV pilus modification protein PilV [Halomonadaceae bacterium]
MSKRVQRHRQVLRPLLRPARGQQQTGFSLLEVMIALVILTIGLLGVAGVQLLSLQQTGNAQLRSQATMVAQDLADRVRVNDGAAPSNEDMLRIRNRMRQEMGEDANVTVTTPGNEVVVTVTWSERDPFAESGRSSETFVLRTRSRR